MLRSTATVSSRPPSPRRWRRVGRIRYTIEGDVEDVSRQHIAGRASFVVHPAAWYVGVMSPAYFVDQKQGFESAVVAVSNEGAIVPGVPVEVTLRQVQWNSVRRAEGQGFYTWETTRNEVEVGTWSVATADKPVPVSIPLPGGGYFEVTAVAKDAEGRSTTTKTGFYSLGAGYTAWERFDHNRITLVPEKTTYAPGDTARVMIQSPWERATALLTTEREGVRTRRQFEITSTQQYVTVPISEEDIPNVYVSVLLVKGRTKDDTPDDGSDPGKPAFRLGYAQLKVEDRSKRLTVAVTANSAEYRPANSARVDIDVKDYRGAASVAEVTLWAVDYGVLSLTAFRTPDILDSVYVPKALQVTNTDNRQRIVSRRALIPKGEDTGGGGGSRFGRRCAAQGLPRARVLGRIDCDRRVGAGERRPQAAGIVDHLSHHGGRRGQGVAIWIGRQRDPDQQTRDAEAGVSAISGRRRQRLVRIGDYEPASRAGRRDRHHT